MKHRVKSCIRKPNAVSPGGGGMAVRVRRPRPSARPCPFGVKSELLALRMLTAVARVTRPLLRPKVIPGCHVSFIARNRTRHKLRTIHSGRPGTGGRPSAPSARSQGMRSKALCSVVPPSQPRNAPLLFFPFRTAADEVNAEYILSETWRRNVCNRLRANAFPI